MGVSYNSKIVTDGLVLCLDAGNRKSYPGTGTAWTDLSGSGNNGTLFFESTYSSANGGSIVFDGIQDCVVVNNSASILSSTAYTKIAWFYPTSFATNNNFISGGETGQHAFWLMGGNTLKAGHNGTWDTVISSTTLSLNTWYCGAVTFNTTTGWILYLNGVQEDTDSSTTTFNGDGDIYIAAFRFGQNNFTGRISNALVYNRVLTATEIQQNYLATKSRYFS